MILHTMFPIDNRLPYRDSRDRFSEESTPITAHEEPLDPYFKRNSISSIKVTLNQDLLAQADSQDVRKEDLFLRCTVDATTVSAEKCLGGNPSCTNKATLHHKHDDTNEQPGETMEKNTEGQDLLQWSHQRKQGNSIGFKRDRITATGSQQRLVYNPKRLAEEFELKPALSDDEDSISSDILDEEIWANEETHQSTTLSTGTKRILEDSFSDLIETSLVSRRGSSIFSTQELSRSSNCIDLQHDEDVKMFTMQSSASVPLTSISIPADSQGTKRVKMHQSSDDRDFIAAARQQVQAQRLKLAMMDSTKTHKSLQERDRKNGLPASHCQTMVNSSRSREQLLSGMVLQKWNGVPLLMLPGARVKVTRRQFRGVRVAEIE